MLRSATSWLVACSLIVFLVGCGDSDPVPEEDVSLGAASDDESGMDSIPLDELETSDSDSTVATSNVPKTADAAMQHLIDGVKEGDYSVYWEIFPTSFQNDLNGLLHDFAGNADPEMWTLLFATFNKTSKVMKSKKEFILASPLFDQIPLKAGDAQADWEPLTELIALIANSELSDQEKVKELDLGEFIAGTGGDIVKQLLAMSKVNPGALRSLREFTDMKIELISSGEDIAVLSMQAPGESHSEVEWIKVEGKWFPRDLALNWKESIAMQREKMLQSLSGSDEQGKERFMGALKNFNLTLDGLMTADNQDDFDTAMAPIIAMAQLASMSLAPQQQTITPPSDGLKNAAIVVVEEKLTEEDLDKILEDLLSKTDRPDESSYAINPSGGTMTIIVTPVSDVEGFSKKISSGTATKLDPEKRIIHLKMAAKDGE